MKTLVIHPDDRTTDFLKIIYEGKGYELITNRQTPLSKLLNLIQSHDRIIMMGHGCPYGLLGMTQQFMNPDFINELRKKECVAIWCNADQYVDKTGIKGFYTGMFISEVSEAGYFRIVTTQEKVTYSNNLFAELMKTIIEKKPAKILNEIKSKYSDAECPVIAYNNARLYYKSEVTEIKDIRPLGPVYVFEGEEEDDFDMFDDDAMREDIFDDRELFDMFGDDDDDIDPAGGHGLHSHI